jgi:Flp pilus assembly pilin Flp
MSIFTKLLDKVIHSTWITSRKAQTLVEYALILAIISVVAIGVFAALGQHIVVIFSSINSLLDTAQSSH